MAKYIYEHDGFPNFTWDDKAILEPLTRAARLQGEILGRMETLGFGLRNSASLEAMTEEVAKSSEIEGETLDAAQIRSSIARRLDIGRSGEVQPSRYVEGVVEMMMDATRGYREKLDYERLCGWHAALFPEGYSGMKKIRTASYRVSDMMVVERRGAREIVNYAAPPPAAVPGMMETFLTWLGAAGNENALVKAAISHLWFVTIHPFDDGNGRIARAVTEMMMCRAENTSLRFYSMSAQIRRERAEYYKALEETTKGGLDITVWLEWFFGCFARAVENSSATVAKIFRKNEFWRDNAPRITDERQIKIINMLFDGFEGNLTTGKAAKICKVSQDTASRLLKDLADKGVLAPKGAGRGARYEFLK